MIIRDLQGIKSHRRGREVKGACAKCGKDVWESEAILDDCYNVWAGRCPHCQAINLLGFTGLRGYSSQGMDLVLPTDEEREANSELPPDTPTSGPAGKPATMHGSILGEICHQLRGEDSPTAAASQSPSPEPAPEREGQRKDSRDPSGESPSPRTT